MKYKDEKDLQAKEECRGGGGRQERLRGRLRAEANENVVEIVVLAAASPG